MSYLEFGYLFRQEIDNLPNSITHLVFGYCFNNKLKPNVLPKYLIKLVFGVKYNQEIEYDVLPIGLKYLTFGYDFNKFIKKRVIPNTVIYLTFGYHFSNRNLQNKSIPDSVKYLFFQNSSFRNLSEIYLPKDLKFILLGGLDKYSIKRIDNNSYISRYIHSYMYFRDDCIDCESIIDNNFNIKILINDTLYKIHIYYLQEIIEKVERNLFMSTVFKELTEKLYHPIRLEKYLEKYGIDMNDEHDFFYKSIF